MANGKKKPVAPMSEKPNEKIMPPKGKAGAWGQMGVTPKGKTIPGFAKRGKK